MSKYEYISLRDCPHEFIITIGDGVKLKRTFVEEILHALRPIYSEFSRSTDLEMFFSFDLAKWNKLNEKGLTLTYYKHFDKDISMEDLAVALRQQTSKSQARKNGWSGPIPSGYLEFNRKFHRFYIFKDVINKLSETISTHKGDKRYE